MPASVSVSCIDRKWCRPGFRHGDPRNRRAPRGAGIDRLAELQDVVRHVEIADGQIARGRRRIELNTKVSLAAEAVSTAFGACTVTVCDPSLLVTFCAMTELSGP